MLKIITIKIYIFISRNNIENYTIKLNCKDTCKILGTIDIKAVQNGKALRSASVSFANTMISYIMFYYIIQSPQYLLEIIAFSLGGSVGAYFIIKKKWY